MVMGAAKSDYMTLTEVREYLGVSRNKIVRWLNLGTLKTVKNPFDARQKLVLRSDVEALAKQRVR